ncbi:MAG: helix-turn-helix transcriptional regulator [Bacteroidota bacterium]
MNTTQIPLHQQNASAIGGLEIRYLTYADSLAHSYPLIQHRDDYYIVVILLKGEAIVQCDMENITAKSKSILLMKPYQVHAAAKISTDAKGYFLSIAPFLMPDHCSFTFQDLSISQQYLKLPRAQETELITTASLLHKAFMADNALKTVIMHSLFNALINQVTALFWASAEKVVSKKNQAYLLTQKFRQLVSESSFLNPPSFFAEKLNITPSHLNDCIKSTTGISATSYLQDVMLLEAKRKLYYTNDDVKTIAYKLGFQDHTYFSRLFKQLAKETPLSFRNKFRE